MTLAQPLNNERGVVLPMALLTLVLLAALMMAFALLAQTEPTVAANQRRIAQARTLAESGVEHAMWALSSGVMGSGDPNAIPDPLPLSDPAQGNSTAVAPWNGGTFMTAGSPGMGGYVVAIRNDQSAAADPNIREITATGWTPTNDPAVATTKAHRTVFARVEVIPNLAGKAPCALCVKGAINIGGDATINGTNTDPACGGNNKFGAYAQNTVATNGTPAITGGAGATAQNQPASTFKNFTYNADALNELKRLAKLNGTYYGPGFPHGGFTSDGSTLWSGSVNFNSSSQMFNGIVFVDTTDGQNLDPSATDTDRMGSLTINGNPALGIPKPGSTLPNVPVSDPGDAFSGMIVVNGTLSISGNMRINGTVYVTNDFTYNGTGGGGIYGLVVSQNMRDISSTSIDTTTSGNSRVEFNCANASNFNMIPPGFKVIAGSYRELPD